MQICVVGATGVLGRSLIPILLKEGHQVRAMARSADRILRTFGENVEAVEFDLLQPGVDQRLPDRLKGSDAVIHIATAIPADFSAPGAWDRNTRLRTEGTRSLIEASLAVGAGNYIQQSIVMAYPDRRDEWISESTPLDTSPKRAGINAPVIEMEALVRSIPAASMHWCILRGGTFTGPGTFQERTIARLCAGEEVVPCEGSYFVSYVHVVDVARAFALAVERAPNQTTFNINADPVWQSEYLDRLAEMHGAPRPPRALDLPCPPSLRCSSQAALETLGWLPEHSIYS